LIKFPDGLLELMADMTREVLRHQPENIFEFLADYLDALRITRDKLQTMKKLSSRLKNQFEKVTIELLTKNGFDEGLSRKMVGIIASKLENSSSEANETFRQRSAVANRNDQHNSCFVVDTAKEELIKICDLTTAEVQQLDRILKSCEKMFRHQELMRKIVEYDYDWINDTVEGTLDYYRKRRKMLVANEMERAAVIIQKAYRRHKGWMATNRITCDGERIRTESDSSKTANADLNNKTIRIVRTAAKNYPLINDGDNITIDLKGMNADMDWKNLDWNRLEMDGDAINDGIDRRRDPNEVSRQAAANDAGPSCFGFSPRLRDIPTYCK